MADHCVLYYITDRSALGGTESARRRRLLDKIAEAAAGGVDYIQLREKDLSARELEALAGEASGIVGDANKSASGRRQQATALLINSRTDVALAVGASGVHLPANDISPNDVRRVWDLSEESCGEARREEASRTTPLISVSCHSAREVEQAAAAGATLALFAPVFEKKDAPGTAAQGLRPLAEAARVKIPVVALGGITLRNAEECLRAGAAGVAGIRLFQDDEIADVVGALRRAQSD